MHTHLYMRVQRLSLLKYIHTQTHPHVHTEAHKHIPSTHMYVLISITNTTHVYIHIETYTCVHTTYEHTQSCFNTHIYMLYMHISIPTHVNTLT